MAAASAVSKVGLSVVAWNDAGKSMAELGFLFFSLAGRAAAIDCLWLSLSEFVIMIAVADLELVKCTESTGLWTGVLL
ncbi:hypothetical protein M0R45_030600 [Rubus argutus]|uniref:Uncharacterized protein n=1 Tax=Rubus argutus TaxID=59490 RepID=A0AAW1WDN2_RUBAR